jgi:hypothetical protein
LFLVHLQLKVCVEWCVLGFGCGLGFVLVVAVVTSSANWKNLDCGYFRASFNAEKYASTCSIWGLAMDRIAWTAAFFGAVVMVANA